MIAKARALKGRARAGKGGKGRQGPLPPAHMLGSFSKTVAAEPKRPAVNNKTISFGFGRVMQGE